jgi:hypothetical protein
MKTKTMPIFNSPIAGAMIREKCNIPHRVEHLYNEKGVSRLQEGYNVTGYFPNRKARRSVLQSETFNQRKNVNDRGTNPRTHVIQRVFNEVKQKVVNILHKIFK